MLKRKKQWSLFKFTFKKLKKLAVFSNFLAFFLFLVDIFTLLDPDTHIEYGSGSRRENEYGSGSTALMSSHVTRLYLLTSGYFLDL